MAEDDFAPPNTFRALVEIRSPDWMSEPAAPNTAAFMGVTLGATQDLMVEAWILATRMALLDDPESPDDVLPVIGRDRRLPQYHEEVDADYRARLIAAWEIYEEGGTEEVIEKQLTAAGYGPTTTMGPWGGPGANWGEAGHFWNDRGAYVQFRPTALGPRGEAAPYRTQFWVVFQDGFHPVTGLPIPWGDFVWGETHTGVWGPQGYDRDFQQTVEGIVRKWKPHDWVFRGFVFKIGTDPWAIGETLWGDSGGVVWGGGIEVNVPLK